MTRIGSHIAQVSFTYYLSFAILALRGIVLIPLLIHVLGQTNYGIYVLALSGISYCVMFSQLGLDSALYQHLTPVYGTPKAPMVFWTAVWSALVNAIVVVAVAGGVAYLLAGSLSHVLIVAGAALVVGQVMWGLALTPFRCQERTVMFISISTMVMLADFCVTVGAAFWFRRVEMVFATLAAFHCTYAVALLSLQATRLHATWWSKHVFSDLFAFGLNGVLNQIVLGGYFVWDRTIISLTGGINAVAAYAPGVALSGTILPLAGSSAATLPTLLPRHEVRESPTMKRAIIRQALNQFLLVGIPAAAGITLVAGPFLHLITPANIAAVSTPVAAIAAWAVLASGMSRFAILALRVEGQDRFVSTMLVATFLGFLLLAGPLSVAFPSKSPLIVVGALLAANVIQALLAHGRLSRYVERVCIPADFIGPVMATCAFAWIRLVFVPHTSFELGGFVFVCIAIYAVAIMLYNGTSLRDIGQMFRGRYEPPSQPAARPPARHRPSIMLYSGPNHLFATTGMLYAAELAEDADVHVVIEKRGAKGITPDILAALAKRNVSVGWLTDQTGIAGVDARRDFAVETLHRQKPSTVFMADDMCPFNVVLGRLAREAGARVVCFQTGSINSPPKLDYEYALNVVGPTWARERGFPLWAGRAYMKLKLHAWHYWHYLIGPMLCGLRPYPGLSSIFLRRGHTGQRDGELFIVHDRTAARISCEAGTPAGKIMIVPHPLSRRPAREMYLDAYPRPAMTGKNPALLLADLPMSAGGGTTRDDSPASNLLTETKKLAVALLQRCDEVIVKPHPGLAHNLEFVRHLSMELGGTPGITVVDPAINALSYLPHVSIVVGDRSTTLQVARFFPNATVVLVSSQEGSAGFLDPSANVHAFRTVDDAVRAIVGGLSHSGQDEGPCGGPAASETSTGILALTSAAFARPSFSGGKL